MLRKQTPRISLSISVANKLPLKGNWDIYVLFSVKDKGFSSTSDK